ncbi:probable carboxylesterase 8 [Trifolium pratense]|uniref:probable carboxylesterase 8 n=1 Tax=Trifolium pratense TaxID=57577 RepID=UPI001E697EAA|nr:probable carboxylesterase 8 [Trifolium pratense]
MAKSSSSKQNSTIDPYKFLKIKLNLNGSLTRNYVVPTVPPSSDPKDSQPALSRDITLNAAAKTSIRLFIPNPPPSSSTTKLPLILYFHGGGFILYHPSSLIFHHSCSTFAAEIPAFVASVDYRLAPEHRLPAAYNDAVESLLWLKSQAQNPTQSDPWIRDHVDFSKCFIMGNSAGGNIAYFAALRALDLDLSPVKIEGLLLNSPFFSGARRTKSELHLINDHILPLPAGDLMWTLSLPKGADRDHVYCNPTVSNAIYGEKIRRLSRTFVNGYGGDPLVDKQKELVKILEAHGVHVESYFCEDGYHAVEIFDRSKAQALVDYVKKFILSTVTPQSSM